MSTAEVEEWGTPLRIKTAPQQLPALSRFCSLAPARNKHWTELPPLPAQAPGNTHTSPILTGKPQSPFGPGGPISSGKGVGPTR